MNEAEAVRRRLRWVRAWHDLRDAGAVCRRYGISRPTLRKWLRRFEMEGEAGLRSQSRRPHGSPGKKVGEGEETIIIDLRTNRRLGIKRLRNEMIRLHGLRLSAATIHKILKRRSMNVMAERKRTRQKPKRYSRPVPGDRVQMDTCQILPGLYQFTAIDDCSRFLVARLAPRRSAAGTMALLDQVFDEMPFAIQRIQTDRGTEFFAEKVQRRLMAEGIKFRPVRPRSPHLNGKVERVQRTMLDEFWLAVDPKASDIDRQLAIWVHHYNWHRPHEALANRCPIDLVSDLAEKTPTWDEVCNAYQPNRERVQVRHYAVDQALRAMK
jgi:transposase InsO family protein